MHGGALLAGGCGNGTGVVSAGDALVARGVDSGSVDAGLCTPSLLLVGSRLTVLFGRLGFLLLGLEMHLNLLPIAAILPQKFLGGKFLNRSLSPSPNSQLGRP